MPIQIRKLEAGRRQLETAITLWFRDADPVSIHTLLAAAHEIIHRFYRRKGLTSLLFDSDLIKNEYRGQWAAKIRRAPNFFKHAGRDGDPDAVIEFEPEANFLLMCFLVGAP